MKKNLLILFAFMLVTVTVANSQCYTLAWSDEFEGDSLDRSKWNVEVGDGFPDLFGWGNSESQYYTDRPENIDISNGTLKIIAKEESYGGRNYTSARIRSQGNFDFKYGRIESRIKIPSGQGTWPAFWLLPTDKVFGGWPASGEIDIMENFGQDNFMSSTIHYDNSSDDWQFNTQTYGVNRDEYHVFAAVWKEDKIDFFIDWLWIGSETPDDVSGTWPFNEDFHFLLNMAIGGSAGSVSTTFPKTMEIDYVRVYQLVEDIQVQGPDLIFKNEIVTYTLPENRAASYIWTVPNDASIISGQNTNEVKVLWGSTNGDISCNVSNWTGDISSTSTNCGDGTHSLSVVVEDGSCEVILLDFDKYQELIPNENDGTGGIETMFFNNPEKDDLNQSDFVGRFGRNGAQQYDILELNFTNPINVSSLYDGTNSFKMDILKELSGNVDITVEFVNRVLNTGYPNGIHSQYTSVMSGTDAWETVEFAPLAFRPDPGIADDMIDGINILFNPNSNTTNKYYFDNLRTTTPVMEATLETISVVDATLNTYEYTSPIYGTSYSWTVGENASIISGENSETVSIEYEDNAFTTTLTLDVTNSMNCDYTYTYNTSISDVVGLNEVELSTISVSPNPFNSSLTISNDHNEEVNYSIISSTGVILKTGTVTSYTELSTTSLNSGIYFLTLDKEGVKASHKIIKE